MQGTVTNLTDWDFAFLKMRVAFYDSSGREMTELCGKYDCVTSAIVDLPARQAEAWTEKPGVFLGANILNPPRASNYRLFFKDGLYRIKWSFALVKPKPSETFSYEDESVSVVIIPTPHGIDLNLRNKTTDPVTVNWNNVSLVDYSGDAHKLIHSGINLKDKEAPQQPTVIPPLARIKETLFPADHVKSTSSGLSQASMWPDFVDIAEDHSNLTKLEGAMFSVFLPLEIQGKTNNYSFIFTTKSVRF